MILQHLQPPPDEPEVVTLESALQPGCKVYVELGGKLYPGIVSRVPYMLPDEVCIETTAARQMSRQWKTLLFFIRSRRAAYGLSKLVIPGLDPIDESSIKLEYEKKKPTETPATLDEPEALSRDDDQPEWEQPSSLEAQEERELWHHENK